MFDSASLFQVNQAAVTGYRKAALAVVISQLLGAYFCGSSVIFALH